MKVNCKINEKIIQLLLLKNLKFKRKSTNRLINNFEMSISYRCILYIITKL